MQKIDVKYLARRGSAKKKQLVKTIKRWLRSKPRGVLAAKEQAVKETWSEVSCVQCGHCCWGMTPTWRKSEIKRVAKHIGISYREFYDKWLYTDKGGDIMNVSTPCQFLNQKSGLCTIYEIRPHDCAEFPHFHRKDFLKEMDFYGDNIPRCPATLKLAEKLAEVAGAARKSGK